MKEKALLRRLIEVSTEIVSEAFEGRTTAHDLLDCAEARIFSLGQSKERSGFSRIKELLWPAMESSSCWRSASRRSPACPAGSTTSTS